MYTKEAETADRYIEKTVHQIGKKYDVTVATSDFAVQMIIWGEGAKRLSASDLEREVVRVEEMLRSQHIEPNDRITKYNTIKDKLSKK